ncbi:hypothetical protein GCM10010171_39960 [Actinokineospora fastidiosa]|uniref:Uncharacterized protein n=1 Tax=Actinokineospora fastidiosa TaxID=1816 RepID=A0A918GIV5_9PSEU|nr:hypothetical protein GCM10010171_39960 [Actinokineospora fastidiosa]
MAGQRRIQLWFGSTSSLVATASVLNRQLSFRRWPLTQLIHGRRRADLDCLINQPTDPGHDRERWLHAQIRGGDAGHQRGRVLRPNAHARAALATSWHPP